MHDSCFFSKPSREEENPARVTADKIRYGIIRNQKLPALMGLLTEQLKKSAT